MALAAPIHAPHAAAQLYDALDAYPPRWHLSHSDCNAEVVSHSNSNSGGVNGRGCETITFVAGQGGTEVVLVYPIEPLLPLDDLTANVSVKSARDGARIGFRVRYPYVEDPETRRPTAVFVYGGSYQRAGEFDSIGVGMIERRVRLKSIALRRQYGINADLSDAYVDAVVLNAYSGPGRNTLRLDELRVDGIVPVGGHSGAQRGADVTPPDPSLFRVPASELTAQRQRTAKEAFPIGHVTRILQYNGEPLEWVRVLGFDAVLLARPPDANMLREAISARVLLYAPPPSAPDPALESLLEPVAGWYLGNGTPLDRNQLKSIEAMSRRLRRWPSRWQRPLIGSPVESYRDYSLHLDGIIDDAPPRVRDVSGDEELAEMEETRRVLGEGVQRAVGINSMPPESLIQQTDAIASSIGALPISDFRWHSMWLQAMRSLETAPSAVLYRSTRSLASGTPLETQRSMALSFINRMIAAIEPWAAGAASVEPPPVAGAAYRAARLSSGDAELIILTTKLTRGSEVLAGDGQALQLQLAPHEASSTFWRLTHFSAERVMPTVDASGSRLQIVSPDVVEIILMSGDPSVGGRAGNLASRFIRQAGMDRWQLTSATVAKTREEWNTLRASGLAPESSALQLANAARRTLREAEPLFRANDFDSTLRMARRADAWGLRSRWRLAEVLMPDWPQPTSSPPMDCGAAEIQAIWYPLMNDEGWGKNRLTTGSLDSPDFLQDGRWQFGKRSIGRARIEVSHTRRGAFSGGGALRAQVLSETASGLPGGYEGTAVQIRSPSVTAPAGTAVRIDAMVRTLGFGDAHQGVLVYDSVGGQEAGRLVRGSSSWIPVRLYRQMVQEGEISVMFELLGAGEATIDEVQLRLWDPPVERIDPRPINELLGDGENQAPVATDSIGRVDKADPRRR